VGNQAHPQKVHNSLITARRKIKGRKHIKDIMEARGKKLGALCMIGSLPARIIIVYLFTASFGLKDSFPHLSLLYFTAPF
jgi:hypothetical protein